MLPESSEPSRLLYFRSTYIVQRLASYPIVWPQKKYTGRGKLGDQAGLPPVSWVQMFLELIHHAKDVFSHADYWLYCLERVPFCDWCALKPNDQQRGLHGKSVHAYVSMIDSLHVWALLSETGLFRRCEMDAVDDVYAKTDITLYDHSGEMVCLALQIGSTNARSCRQYKSDYRGVGDKDCILIELPMSRPIGPGNKRWHELADFANILNRPGESCDVGKQTGFTWQGG